MRRMKFFIGLAVLLLFVGPACAAGELGVDFYKKARGTTVTFYGWGGDQRVNAWLDDIVAPQMKERHGVTLRRVGMNIRDILNKLENEKQAGQKGSIDVMWINGENFAAAREHGLLYGPFTEVLPNFRKYVDVNASHVTHDFGYPTEGYEAPFGTAQLVFFVDTAKVETVPHTIEDLTELTKIYPGRIAYAAPPDFTGSAFVRTVICNFIPRGVVVRSGTENLVSMAKPAMNWLRQIAPRLLGGGETYAESNAQLLKMYAEGKIYMGMSYTPFLAFREIALGKFPATTRPFVLEGGTAANTHFLAIPFNAPNKAGAAALIDMLLSPELQASKMDPRNWGDLPAIDLERLSARQKALFENVLTDDEAAFLMAMLKKHMPELPADMVPVIDDLWTKDISPK